SASDCIGRTHRQPDGNGARACCESLASRTASPRCLARYALKGRPGMRSSQAKSRARSDIRFLPAVIGVGAILLALKAGGIAFDARAAESAAEAEATEAVAAAQPSGKAPAAPAPFSKATPPARKAPPSKLPAQPTTPITESPLP